MKDKLSFWLTAVVFQLCSATDGYAVVASFQGLGNLPGEITESMVYNISGDGAVVVGSTSHNVALRWTETEGLQNFDPSASSAYAGSADGSVIVGGTLLASHYGNIEAYRWTESSGLVGLGKLPYSTYNASVAWDVSDDGTVIIGSSGGAMSTRAFRWTLETGMVELGTLPIGPFSNEALACSADGSIIVGRTKSREAGADYYDWEAFIWTETEGMRGLGDLPGGRYWSTAYDVSADGQTVVGCSIANGYQAFRWTAAEGMVGLDGANARAYGISADASVIVGSSNRACFWDRNNTLYDLKVFLEERCSLDLDGWTLVSARAISDDNLTIVGHGINPQGMNEGWIATIPEPGTVAILGLGGLVLLRRRELQ